MPANVPPAGTDASFVRSYRAACSGEENGHEEIDAWNSRRRSAFERCDGSNDRDDHDRYRSFDRDDRAGGPHQDQELRYREIGTACDDEGAHFRWSDRAGRRRTSSGAVRMGTFVDKVPLRLLQRPRDAGRSGQPHGRAGN